jgi:hypothetical protein
MGEDQWFQPTVRNRLPDGTDIVLKNFDIKYGKFYNISEYLRLFASFPPLPNICL